MADWTRAWGNMFQGQMGGEGYGPDTTEGRFCQAVALSNEVARARNLDVLTRRTGPNSYGVALARKSGEMLAIIAINERDTEWGTSMSSPPWFMEGIYNRLSGSTGGVCRVVEGLNCVCLTS